MTWSQTDLRLQFGVERCCHVEVEFTAYSFCFPAFSLNVKYSLRSLSAESPSFYWKLHYLSCVCLWGPQRNSQFFSSIATDTLLRDPNCQPLLLTHSVLNFSRAHEDYEHTKHQAKPKDVPVLFFPTSIALSLLVPPEKVLNFEYTRYEHPVLDGKNC